MCGVYASRMMTRRLLHTGTRHVYILVLAVAWLNACDRSPKGLMKYPNMQSEPTSARGTTGKKMRRPGIEPGASRWQRDILPLNQRRYMILLHTLSHYTLRKHHNGPHPSCHSNHYKHHHIHNKPRTLYSQTPSNTSPSGCSCVIWPAFDA